MTLSSRKRKILAVLFALFMFALILICGQGLAIVGATEDGDLTTGLSALIYFPCIACFAFFVAAGGFILVLSRLRRPSDPLI